MDNYNENQETDVSQETEEFDYSQLDEQLERNLRKEKYEHLYKLVGHEIIYFGLGDFYLWMLKQGYTHTTTMRYCYALVLFIKSRKISTKKIRNKILDRLCKDDVVDYVRHSKDKVFQFALKHFLKFIYRNDKSINYLGFYQGICDGIKHITFPKRDTQIVITKKILDEIILNMPALIYRRKRLKSIQMLQDGELFLKILYETGLRQNAIFKLLGIDVYFENERAWITVTEKRGLKIRMPLSIPTSQRLYDKVHSMTNKNSRIFDFSYETFLWNLNRIVKIYNIPVQRFTFHAVRRGRALDLFEKTKDIRVVKAYLHHSSIMTTQIYIESLGQDLTKLVDGVQW
jgi:integrase